MTFRSVLMLTLTTAYLSLASAANLVVVKSLTLKPGEHLQQPVAAATDDGVRVQVSLGDAPDGARLVVDASGQLFIDWQTGPELAPQTIIRILLTDINSARLLESRDLLIHRAEQALDSDGTPTLSNRPPEVPDSAAAMSIPAVAPVLIALPNQVVSAGVVISMHVDAMLPNGLIPELQVDRLPRKASFEANKDGSRTFYWDTTTSDEGEHVFRFTAINPDDAQVRSFREVMIVVGDPSRKTTRPQQAAGGIMQ